MTRPRKQTVDYFPHYCRHGQTMEILEQEYGLAGYAFWFKLLERLGDTDGHFLDCKNPLTWGFLRSKTRTDGKTAEDILNLLADLEAIDKDLWKNDKIVWCQNFVNNIADAYRNRIVDIPIRPEIKRKKSSSNGVSDVRNPQRREEESIGEERRGEKICAPLFFSCTYFNVDVEYRQKLSSEYPLLDDKVLAHELSKMEDWLSDNQGRKKFGANGKVKNPKLFIKNWLDKMTVTPETVAKVSEPKGYAGIREFLKEGS